MVANLIELAEGSDYPLEAFGFVQRGLEFTVQHIHGKAMTESTDPVKYHVSGRALCHGLRDYAIREYGLLSRTVLRRWNINNCEDFGSIVFIMVEAGILAKTEDDSIDNFRHVYDFDEAFTEILSLSEGS